MRTKALVAIFSCVVTVIFPLQTFAQNTLVLDEHPRYQALPYPDRIILLPGTQGELSYQVSWRTDESVAIAEAEIVLSGNSPALSVDAKTVRGNTQALSAGNGLAHHHAVEFSQLASNTLYAYRVKGAGVWSEWFQFRTPDIETPFPFEVLYFGDAQNSVKSLFSRVVRQAVLSTRNPALMIHAGDMIDRMGNQDYNWGEWFDALDWVAPSLLQLPVAGNHEYNETTLPPQRVPQWDAQFVSADNGPVGFGQTVFYSDYQKVRFVVLDSTRAIHDENAAIAQAGWLAKVLSDNDSLWTVVIYHHPMVSVSHGIPNPILTRHWQPLFDQYGVDLVLQGHDHVYGRGTLTNTGNQSLGPVYIVSVAGPKMNLVSRAATEALSVTGEDVQLYQSIRFSGSQLSFESRTAAGDIYDSFQLSRLADGTKELIDATSTRQGLKGSDCKNSSPVAAQIDAGGVARPGRCWDGIGWQ
ncbi:MAG: metallophosphoesterase family protein [Pseudohongiella sp.]|nr:metallophosphoesterase family protein [Pseudohongiella sp.]